MADAHGSGPCVRKDVGVQLPPCPLWLRQTMRAPQASTAAGLLSFSGHCSDRVGACPLDKVGLFIERHRADTAGVHPAGSPESRDIAHALIAAGVAEVDPSTLARGLYSSDASLYRVVPLAVVRPRS